ncbi:MAG: hypothetical protein VKO39_10025 [Cyanobacteriota bacterium]|nr:hypothetical protein [Cyanobacteriota bacterium]
MIDSWSSKERLSSRISICLGKAMSNPFSASEQRQILVDILRENGGRVSNSNARRLLADKLPFELSDDDYEQLKGQLISKGTIKKAQGRGGSIELLPQASETTFAEPENTKAESINSEERVQTLLTSLNAAPGIRAKKNKTTITVLCGEDNDKLYCGWAPKRAAYFVSYRIEKGKQDCSDIADSLFREASSDIPYASVDRFLNTTSLYLCDNVAQINMIIRRLSILLDSTSLLNGPVSAEPPGKPRSEAYFLEIATLIKFCVDNNLYWPLKNWRKTLGFDDVDDLIVFGRSPTSHTAPYREHVIPASLIREEAKNLAEKGAPAHVIAEFIRCHLYVVIISEEEAVLLNKPLDKGGRSLKNSMPEGWIFGDDPLERLISAGITIHVDYQGPDISNWKPWKGPRLRDKIRGALNAPIIKL